MVNHARAELLDEGAAWPNPMSAGMGLDRRPRSRPRLGQKKGAEPRSWP